MNQSVDDYPVSALVYAVVVSLGLTVAGLAVALWWGQSISRAILHHHV